MPLTPPNNTLLLELYLFNRDVFVRDSYYDDLLTLDNLISTMHMYISDVTMPGVAQDGAAVASAEGTADSTAGNRIGKKVILPATVTGCPRQMHQLYQVSTHTHKHILKLI